MSENIKGTVWIVGLWLAFNVAWLMLWGLTFMDAAWPIHLFTHRGSCYDTFSCSALWRFANVILEAVITGTAAVTWWEECRT